MVVAMRTICWQMKQLKNLPLLWAVLLFSCSIEPDTNKLPIIQPELGFSIYQEFIIAPDLLLMERTFG